MTAGSLRPPEPAGSPLPEWTQYLTVDADLDIELDSAAGRHATGRLTSQGHRLRLEFDHPEVLAGTADRSVVTAVAAQLHQAQLRAELHGPRGRIAVFDPAQTSRVAALVAGSPHITIDRPGWLLAARAVAPATLGAVAVGVTAVLTAAAVVRSRRRS